MRLRDEWPCDGWVSEPAPPPALPAAWLDAPPAPAPPPPRLRADEKSVIGGGVGSDAAADEEEGERGVGRGRERGLLLADPEWLPLDAPPLTPDRLEVDRASASLLLTLLLAVRVVEAGPAEAE